MSKCILMEMSPDPMCTEDCEVRFIGIGNFFFRNGEGYSIVSAVKAEEGEYVYHCKKLGEDKYISLASHYGVHPVVFRPVNP